MPERDGVVRVDVSQRKQRGETSKEIGYKNVQDSSFFFQFESDHTCSGKLTPYNGLQCWKNGNGEILLTEFRCQKTDHPGGEKKIPDTVWFKDETPSHCA